MVDYENWDQVDPLKIRHAACLWCGVQPTNSWLLDKINFPQIIPIYEMLERAYQAGDLKTNNSIKIDMEHLLTNIDGFAGEMVARRELIRFAVERGQSPAFLFPNERNKSAAAVEPEPEPDYPPETHTGLPGRPTSKQLYEVEFARRVESGEIEVSAAEQARVLLKWFKQEHPDLPSSKT